MPVAGEPTEPLNVQPRAEAVTCQVPEVLTVSPRTAGTAEAVAFVGAFPAGRATAAAPAPTVLTKVRRLNPGMGKLLGGVVRSCEAV